MTSFGLPWSAWEPVYEAILADFGFSRSADEAARDELAAMIGDGGLTPATLPDARDSTAAIVGAAQTIEDELDDVVAADLVFGVSAASGRLLEAGIDIAVHVTDLDEDDSIPRELGSSGVPLVIHAHGDNRDALGRLVPELDPATIFPTTQAEPIEAVYNPGGFTDGDRAAFVADALGAGALTFPGWRFDDPTVSAVKRRKLAWAARLLRWLEIRRDERFGLLDGVRDDVEFPPGVRSSRED